MGSNPAARQAALNAIKSLRRKADAVAQALSGSPDTPAGQVRGREATKWFIDRDAGRELPWFECDW